MDEYLSDRQDHKGEDEWEMLTNNEIVFILMSLLSLLINSTFK